MGEFKCLKNHWVQQVHEKPMGLTCSGSANGRNQFRNQKKRNKRKNAHRAREGKGQKKTKQKARAKVTKSMRCDIKSAAGLQKPRVQQGPFC